ncbi:MAG: hypothetical protein A2Z11_00390 [Candidatus Woykebacteria bacterium RBG_16_43_9]|uniref:Uncharacterized protein n=1 Tax=Candidatus Woykebacteria bacterium RBG_16_43_9 TaxID=1802596 RepID=A0A1G1WCQ0_9BACT|nr:MAG: hypothetical protein A2Z11_00390 [Candidatus Woykebacteria bacterium RBG_16_43_9]
MKYKNLVSYTALFLIGVGVQSFLYIRPTADDPEAAGPYYFPVLLILGLLMGLILGRNFWKGYLATLAGLYVGLTLWVASLPPVEPVGTSLAGVNYVLVTGMSIPMGFLAAIVAVTVVLIKQKTAKKKAS